MTWVTAYAPAPADLDACVSCGLCLPVCPTFRLTGDEAASPRGRLAAIAAAGNGLIAVDDRFGEVTSFCLQCRACETACPSMVPYGDIIEGARAEVMAQIPGRAPRLRRLAVGRVLAWPVALRLITIVVAVLQRLHILRRLPGIGDQTTGLRAIPLEVPTIRGESWGDTGRPDVVLFAGCVADVWFGDVHRAAIDVLLRAGYRVTAPAGQVCCGALAAHGGLAEEANAMAETNARVLGGTAPIAVDVAGCGAHLKGYDRYGFDGIARRTRDITELVAEAISDGRLPRFASVGESVAVMDPCHLEHGQKITRQPRSIIRAAGYDVVDVDPGGLCCGAAGLYQLDQPEAGGELGARKAAAVEATGASIVAAANAGCEMQLRRFLDGGYRVVHPVELYWRRLESSGSRSEARIDA